MEQESLTHKLVYLILISQIIKKKNLSHEWKEKIVKIRFIYYKTKKNGPLSH